MLKQTRLRCHLIFLCGILLVSCNDDLPFGPIDKVMDDPMDTMQVVSCIGDTLGYTNYKVEFYTYYPYVYRVVPSTFETISEQVLIKDAGTTESVYENDSIVVIVKEAYNSIHVMSNLDSVRLATNLCAELEQAIPCIDSTFMSSYEYVDVPAQYKTIIYEKLVEYNPNGDTIPQQYLTNQWRALVTSAVVTQIDNFQETSTIIFTLPDSLDIIKHLSQSAENAGYPKCLEEENFKVIE